MTLNSELRGEPRRADTTTSSVEARAAGTTDDFPGQRLARVAALGSPKLCCRTGSDHDRQRPGDQRNAPPAALSIGASVSSPPQPEIEP